LVSLWSEVNITIGRGWWRVLTTTCTSTSRPGDSTSIRTASGCSASTAAGSRNGLVSSPMMTQSAARAASRNSAALGEPSSSSRIFSTITPGYATAAWRISLQTLCQLFLVPDQVVKRAQRRRGAGTHRDDDLLVRRCRRIACCEYAGHVRRTARVDLDLAT